MLSHLIEEKKHHFLAKQIDRAAWLSISQRLNALSPECWPFLTKSKAGNCVLNPQGVKRWSRLLDWSVNQWKAAGPGQKSSGGQSLILYTLPSPLRCSVPTLSDSQDPTDHLCHWHGSTTLSSPSQRPMPTNWGFSQAQREREVWKEPRGERGES